MKQRTRRGTGEGRRSDAPLPRALRDGVLTTDLGDEVVVYDSKQHRGHCLNRSAAVVYRNLDGQASLSDVVARLREELDGPADEDTVWMALKQLDEAQLLDGPLDLPASHEVSRRHMLGRMGVSAVLVPAIMSVTAPPAHAQVSAAACPTPDTCLTFSCVGGCACVSTTEAAIVCVVPACVSACTTSADCPAGTVCFTLGCCGPATFCVPIAPPGGCAGLLAGAKTWEGPVRIR
jgi:hypothetical protein